MIWQHFYKELLRLKEEGITFDLSNGILIHGGGWKKLISEAVSHDEFHERLKDACGLEHIHDYYEWLNRLAASIWNVNVGISMPVISRML